ncbi:MAG: hypothetical protein A3C11_00465 [Candidatus Sungbacteria bacterium RIFCSPHIGHO2_02_FULL_49_12]|uniref:Uncharacterized protein n=1 Tax=Candidatus Sungbacteria bacterium RIFCSPHIGHO2_02_FULL_49_12 TaxID=1802271 RepID=A0A1G2KM97_9BACT|nr:MAG: hypothetical protein A3C11_00465 [Candidatus Sungbacteria bacterium RIFCSPHIGHO2_02_FULL_49_12]
MRIIDETITKQELRSIAKNQFGDMVKAVVDIEKKIMAVGGELHADEEALLLDKGSHQASLWGINLYPDKSDADWIEFDSMINIRPSQENTSRRVNNPEIQEKIRAVIAKLTR